MQPNILRAAWRAAALLCVSLLIGVSVVAPSSAQDTPPTEVPTEASAEASAEATSTEQSVPQPTRQARIAPQESINGEKARLELYFQVLPQGTTGLARISLIDDSQGVTIANARARFLDGFIDFFPMDDGVYGLLSTNMEQQTRRDYPLDVYVTFNDGTRETLSTTVEVTLGAFIRQQVTLPPSTAYLIDAATERNELAQLESIFTTTTDERLWDDSGFAFPINAALTSPFGAFRTFNGSYNTRHTGWDFRIALGAPVMASAAGRVVFAGTLPIRGNHVIVDHGYGVYTTYSHFSVVYVTRGERVEKGQVIGLVGSTGRTSGPHFHWEVAVNGNFVDGAQFVTMWMP